MLQFFRVTLVGLSRLALMRSVDYRSIALVWVYFYSIVCAPTVDIARHHYTS